jgi:hypothetical protein
MSKNRFWYGYLEAGSKSTGVVMDSKLNTGDPDTIYLYNHARDMILEYKQAIVSPKLRELGEDDAELIKELKAAFTKAGANFTPRADRLSNVPEAGSGKAAAKKPMVQEAVTEEGDESFSEDFEDDSGADEEEWEEDED